MRRANTCYWSESKEGTRVSVSNSNTLTTLSGLHSCIVLKHTHVAQSQQTTAATPTLTCLISTPAFNPLGLSRDPPATHVSSCALPRLLPRGRSDPDMVLCES